jgi:translation initiation factor IF-1
MQTSISSPTQSTHFEALLQNGMIMTAAHCTGKNKQFTSESILME